MPNCNNEIIVSTHGHNHYILGANVMFVCFVVVEFAATENEA